MKLIQFEKTGSLGKLFIPQGHLRIKFRFSKLEVTFLVIFTTDSGVCLPFTKRNELILKRNQKVKPRKSKFEPEQSLRLFPEKKTNHRDLYKS